jgi:hypothetical protein
MAYDNDFGSVKLLLHCDGTDSSTTFTDSETTPKTVTPNGDAHIHTGEKKFGTASAAFDGTGDYLSLADSADWYFAADDWTIEFWIKSPGNGAYDIVMGQRDSSNGDNANAPISIHRSNQTAKLDVALWNGSGNTNMTTTAGVFDNTWRHIAVVRYGINAYIYVDGTQSATTGFNYTMSNSSTLFSIGRGGEYAGRYFAGYLDDIRITKGVARYTANFSVPTEAFPDAAPPLSISMPPSFGQFAANQAGFIYASSL